MSFECINNLIGYSHVCNHKDQRTLSALSNFTPQIRGPKTIIISKPLAKQGWIMNAQKNQTEAWLFFGSLISCEKLFLQSYHLVNVYIKVKYECDRKRCTMAAPAPFAKKNWGQLFFSYWGQLFFKVIYVNSVIFLAILLTCMKGHFYLAQIGRTQIY